MWIPTVLPKYHALRIVSACYRKKLARNARSKRRPEHIWTVRNIQSGPHEFLPGSSAVVNNMGRVYAVPLRVE